MKKQAGLASALAMMIAFAGVMTPVAAGEADVLKVDVARDGNGTWRFSVTVKHADEGWNHYANAFEVLTMKGDVLGTRTLFHPHEHEQPFTRSLGGVAIPDGVEKVRIRARDSVHDFGGAEIVVTLPKP